MSNSNDAVHPSSFDTNEEQWFSERPARRPSQRPTCPAPALDAASSSSSRASIDDSIADGWFLDI